MSLAPSPSPAALAPLVGARIAVFWPLDDIFYPATIIYALSDNRHVVLYNDKCSETLNLSAERFRVLARAPPPPPPLKSHIIPSLTHVPLPLPPRKRYSRRYGRLKRSRPRISLMIRVRPPARSPRLAPSPAKPRFKLSSTKGVLSDISDIPPSPPTSPPKSLSQLPT